VGRGKRQGKEERSKPFPGKSVAQWKARIMRLDSLI
jgi:hypothetical protein